MINDKNLQADEVGSQHSEPTSENLAARQSEMEKEIILLKASTSKAKEIWIPLFSVIVALAGVFSGILGQAINAKSQLAAKQLEVTFEAKRTGYAGLLSTIQMCFLHASDKITPATVQCMDKAQVEYFSVEPFLRKDTRNEAWDDMQNIEALCLKLAQGASEKERDSIVADFLQRRNRLRNHLQQELFTDIQR
jgi:hypothetical protein